MQKTVRKTLTVMIMSFSGSTAAGGPSAEISSAYGYYDSYGTAGSLSITWPVYSGLYVTPGFTFGEDINKYQVGLIFELSDFGKYEVKGIASYQFWELGFDADDPITGDRLDYSIEDDFPVVGFSLSRSFSENIDISMQLEYLFFARLDAEGPAYGLEASWRVSDDVDVFADAKLYAGFQDAQTFFRFGIKYRL